MKIRDLKEKVEGIGGEEPIFLSSWQRNFVWSLEKISDLYETIIKKMTHDYCDIDDIKIGRYRPDETERTLTYLINYKNPTIGKSHRKVGKKRLNRISHLQDGQQRITSILFMLYGDYIKEKSTKWYLFYDIFNKDFYFDKRQNTLIQDGGRTNCIKSQELFKIFMDTRTSTTRKAEQCEHRGFDYDDVFNVINHILEFQVNFEYKQYNNISEALDDFKRTNSGHALSSYDLFINNLIEFVGDMEFDKFFESATKNLNSSIPVFNNSGNPIPYFKKNNSGKADFALNLMTYRSEPNENHPTLSHFEKHIIQGTNGCIENEPVNEETINEFKNRLARFLKKLLNTKIEVESSNGNHVWETTLPYKFIFNSCRLPVVSVLRHMGITQGRNIDARSNGPLEEQAIRFLLHLVCLGNKSHSKHTPSSKELFKCTSLEEFSEYPLELVLDEIPIDTRIQLVATSLKNNLGYVETTVIPHAKKKWWASVFRSGDDLLTEGVSRDVIEILPPTTQQRNFEPYIERRKKEINKRLVALLEKYNIRVL